MTLPFIPKFSIGDKVFIASVSTVRARHTCPDCGGTRGCCGVLYYNPHATDCSYTAAIARFGQLIEAFPGVDDWIAEASFAHPSGYGGKVDLHSPSTGIVVDWKGKDGDFSDGKKLAYDQHWQLAAYQDGLRLPRNVCANGFVSRTHPGAVRIHVWTRDEVEQGSQVFLQALALWKAIKGFDPSFSTKEGAA